MSNQRKRGRAAYTRPEDVGYWDGDDFVFFQPRMVGDRVMTRLKTGGMQMGPGITREDVIHALINPVAMQRMEREQ